MPATDVRVWVRVNAGAEREADVRAVAGPGLTGLVAAKTETVRELDELDALLTSLGSSAGVVPLLESAAAVLSAKEIAGAPRVRRLQVGEADLRADVGIETGPDERELLYARSHVVLASRAAGVAPPIAPVSTQFRDLPAFARVDPGNGRLGFVGRACIHPAQVAVANEVFTPSPEAVEAAGRLLATSAARVRQWASERRPDGRRGRASPCPSGAGPRALNAPRTGGDLVALVSRITPVSETLLGRLAIIYSRS